MSLEMCFVFQSVRKALLLIFEKSHLTEVGRYVGPFLRFSRFTVVAVPYSHPPSEKVNDQAFNPNGIRIHQDDHLQWQNKVHKLHTHIYNDMCPICAVIYVSSASGSRVHMATVAYPTRGCSLLGLSTVSGSNSAGYKIDTLSEDVWLNYRGSSVPCIHVISNWRQRSRQPKAGRLVMMEDAMVRGHLRKPPTLRAILRLKFGEPEILLEIQLTSSLLEYAGQPDRLTLA